MEHEIIDQVKRQLADQSASLDLLQGVDAAVSVLDTCAALLKSIRRDVETASAEDLDELYYGYLSVADEIGGFLRIAEKQLEPSMAERIAAGTREKLEEMRGDAEEKRRELDERKKALLKLTEEVSHREIEQRDLEAAERALDQRAAACTEEALETLRQENESREAVIRKNEETLKEYSAEKAVISSQLEEQEKTILGFPQEIRDLRDQYEKRDKVIEELKHARELYSPEVLEEQADRENKLIIAVEKLTAKSDGLRNSVDKLTKEHTALTESFPLLEAKAISAVWDVLNKLAPQVEAKRQEVSQLRDVAEELDRNLSACNDLRKKYRGWLNGVRTPLEALLKACGESESETLRRTLDPAKCSSIRTLLEQVRSGLDQLDQELKRLSDAYRQDVQRIQKEASTHGGTA